MDETPRSLLVFRNGSIGNTLVAVPALRALHRRFPEVPLHVVVDPVGGELLRHCPWIASLIVYDRRGRDAGVAGWLRLVRRLRAVRPTHAILLKRFFRNGLLARMAGARVRIGYETNGRAPFLTRTLPYREGTNIARLNLDLVALLGAATDDARPELWLGPDDRRAAAAWLDRSGLTDRRYVVGHYGGRSTPPDFLPRAAFARLLERAAPAGLILLAAGERECAWAQELRERLPGAQVASGTPLRTAAALIERAALFIGFNSGPAHIAAALDTPARIVFRPGPGSGDEIAKWLPLHLLARPLVPPESADPGVLATWLETAPLEFDGATAPEPVPTA